MSNIEKSSLLPALRNMLGVPVIDASCETETLHGGTVGDVCLVSGLATAQSGPRPYRLVVKTQRRWERYGDPGCWRREYDIYHANMDDELPGMIRLPRCYLLEEEANLTRVWMEYIDGATGSNQLHLEELALVSERLGRFQAQYQLRGRRDLPWLREYPAVRSSFHLWWGRMAAPLGGSIAGFPEELRHALNAYAARADEALASIDSLPLTLCQGDVHHDNLILREEADGIQVYLIDWDCAGYGRMGEDAVDVLMEAFAYSDRDVSLLPAYRRRIVDSYCRGVRQQGVDMELGDALVRDIFALAWGFRIADLYLYYKEDAARQKCIDMLRTMLLP